ncbi:MAG: cytidylate kinase-like family protein [Dehalococcoidales bacterium]|nr:cytidylate kinase-like family protein [Dehalococcoidales bacterium]
MPVITIRGKLGSGAPEIGKLIAEKLGIDYIDREIIAQVATMLSLEEHEIIAKETPPYTLRGRIGEALQRGYAAGVGIQGAYLPVWQIPLDDNRYIEALGSFIKELAQGHSAVIFGRGSQFILRNHPQTTHVSVTAPFNTRLKRIMEAKKLNEDAAKKEICHSDNMSREFNKRYFGADPEAPANYDLVINTERISYETAAAIVLETLKLSTV